MTDPVIRTLAARIAALEAQVGKRGEQLAYSALEDGAIREFDLEGTQTAQYGQQFDGTSAATTLVSPPPPRPTAPVVLQAPGGLKVLWDGMYVDPDTGDTDVAIFSPMDWARVDVAVGSPGFDPIGTPPAHSFTSPRGGEVFFALEPGSYEVALVARAAAGTASIPSVVRPGVAVGIPTQTALDEVMASANGKTKVTFSDNAPPTAPDPAPNDGDVWFMRSEDGESIEGVWEAVGGAYSQRALAHQAISSVDAGTITVGKLRASVIDSGDLGAELAVIGRLVAGGNIGARVEVSSAGIFQYAADGSARVVIPTDPDAPTVFEGDFVAASLTIQDRFALRGETNEISKGSALALSSGTSAPTSPPSLQVAYEQYDGNVSEYLFAPRGFHHEADGGDRWLMSTFFGDTHMLTPAGGYAFPKVTTSTGASYATFDVQDSTVINTPTGRRVVGIGWKNTEGGVAQMGMQSFDPAPISGNNSPTGPTWKAGLYAGFVSSWGSDHKLGRCISPAGSLASLENQVAEVEWLDNASQKTNYALKLRRWAVTDAGIVQQGATVNVTGLWSNANVAGVVYGSSARMGFPGADQNIWLVFGGGMAWAYSATGTRLADFDFPLNTGADHIDVAGSTAPGVNGFVGFRSLPNTPNGDGYRLVTKYTNNHWVTGTPSKWWVSATWYDPDATDGTHETAQGPRSVITMAKRASLLVTVPPFPSRPSPTTTDDVTAAKIYIGRGDVDPGRTKMELLGQANSPNRGLVVGDVTFPVALAAVPPPAASNFPQSSPGRITSSDGVSWVLAGDGTVDLQGSTFGPAGTTLSSPGGSYLSVVSPMLLTGDLFVRNTRSLVLGDFADPNTGYFYSRKKAADGTSTLEEVSGLIGDTPIQIFRRNGVDISSYTKTLTAHLFGGQKVVAANGIQSDPMAFVDSGYVGGAQTVTGTTNYQRHTSGPAIAFTAPPSGRVMVHAQTFMKTSSTSYSAEAAVFLVTGTNVNGTLVGSEPTLATYNVDWVRSGDTVPFTGLTPGASYTVYTGFRINNAAGTASISTGRLIVQPCL